VTGSPLVLAGSAALKNFQLSFNERIVRIISNSFLILFDLKYILNRNAFSDNQQFHSA